MMSVTASHEIRASVAGAWEALADVEQYGSWHPCFAGIVGPPRALRSGDCLTAVVRHAARRPADVPIRVLVLEVRRYRSLSLLLLPPADDVADSVHPGAYHADSHVAAYRVDIGPGADGGIVIGQSLSIGHPPGVDLETLASLLDEMPAALAERAAAMLCDEDTERPITGTIRVSSRSGWRQHGMRPHPGLLTRIAGWMTRRPQRVAA